MTRRRILFAASILAIAILLPYGTAMAQFELSEPEVETSDTPPVSRNSVPAQSRGGRTKRDGVDQGATANDKGRGLTFENAPTPRIRPSGEQRAIKTAPREASTIQLVDEETERPQFFSGPVARTEAIGEDAALNDICHVGVRCFAVGERGVFCFSEDGGESWKTRFVPFECSLNSVCFLTNTIGWVGGIRVIEGTSRQVAVLLHTRDGGQTWADLAFQPSKDRRIDAVSTANLPGIVHVQFFGLETGIAMTLPHTDRGGDGIFRTNDSGQTWSAIPPDQRGGPWTAAHFLSESDGVFVGRHQSYGVLVASQAVVVSAVQPTLRQMRGVSLTPDGEGWIVGDGATVLTTSNAGVTWHPPGKEIPSAIADMADLNTVAHHDSVVLMGGNPGSLILRSETAGNDWESVSVPVTGRINQVRFLSATEVVAVGSLGQILRSSDAGASWRIVRSAGFRPGILNLVTDANKAAWQLLASASAEDGIRSTVIQLSPPLDLNNGESSCSQNVIDSRTQQAVTQLGGNDIASHWMFPRTKPEHHRSSEQLIAEWNRQTDGRLRRLLPLRLARDIRNWRPGIIVIESMSDDDAVAGILRDVVPQAVRLASANDDSEESAALSGIGLSPWSVERVLSRVTSDRTALLSFDDSDLLTSCGTTIGLLCDAADRIASNRTTSQSSARSRAGYEILYDSNDSPAVSKLFTGIERALTLESRRQNVTRNHEDVDALRKTLQSAQLESSALAGHLSMNGAEGSLEGQLRDIGENLPETLALKQLRDLASLNLQRNNMEGYLAVQQEVTRRFPRSEDAREASEMLFLFYSSAEARHYRIRAQFRPTQQSRRSDLNRTVPKTSDSEVDQGFMVKPVEQRPEVQALPAGNGNQLDLLFERWDSHAATALKILSERDTKVSETGDVSPLVRLRVAANLRNQDRTGDPTSILSELSQRADAFGTFARSEMQAMAALAGPLPVFNLPRRNSRPFLDGKLTDSIWEESMEMPLVAFRERSPFEDGVQVNNARVQDESHASSLAMIAWDDEFLYVSARLERASQKPNPVELATHRSHDARHENRDRFEFEFDTDRDFGTSFQFCVDESGLTSERCWMLEKWNPDWFVAIDSDDSTWRFEAAIPLAELSSPIAKPGDLWVARLRRVIPGVLQHEIIPSENTLSTNGTCMIRFIRAKVLSGKPRQ